MTGQARPVVTVRAHVASLVAVFLALAVGVLVGGVALHATEVHDLRTRATSADADAAAARSSAARDGADSARSDAVSVAAVTRLLGARLRGHDVVVVSLPGADPRDRDRLGAGLRAAGASMGGDLRLASAAVQGDAIGLLGDVAGRLDPRARGAALDRFATVLAQAGTSARTRPAAAGSTQPTISPTISPTTPRSQGAAPVPAVPVSTARLVPTLRAAALLDVGSRVDGAADLAVIVVPPGGDGSAVDGATDALTLALARAMAARGTRVLVSGPATSARPGGAVAAVRRDVLRATVSSTDGLDAAAGPAVAGLALVAPGPAGHYGSGPAASAPLPPT